MSGINKSPYKFAILFLIAVFFVSNAGCARFLKPTKPLEYSLYSPEGAVPIKGGEYVIGGRDTLDVAVWRCPELSVKVTVRPDDGRITLPLIGEIKATGQTPRELAQTISQKMAHYVKDPRVAVGVLKIGDKKVFVMGQVLRQGAYRLDRSDRLIDIITQAGGFTSNAVPSCTHIVRGGYKNPEVVRVNLSRLIRKGDVSQNVYLMEGDIVYIPENEIEQVNYLLRKVFPSMFFAEKLNDLKQNIMQGGFDWHEVWAKMSDKWDR
ncbi:MAG: polysaccharide biosynthesis/export family protein [Candidatus Omnitrophota bacterium]